MIIGPPPKFYETRDNLRAITTSADSLPGIKTADQADTITAPTFLDAALVIGADIRAAEAWGLTAP